MEKLTNKQHTDYCEILNDFRCKAIDIIDELTKDYKNTLAEEIDGKLNDYHTHNEYLICKLENLRQENEQLKEQYELLIDEFQKEREKLCEQIKAESDARKRFVKELKVYEKALELACDFAGLDTDKWSKEFIEQAKDSMK